MRQSYFVLTKRLAVRIMSSEEIEGSNNCSESCDEKVFFVPDRLRLSSTWSYNAILCQEVNR